MIRIYASARDARLTLSVVDGAVGTSAVPVLSGSLPSAHARILVIRPEAEGDD